ncbi:hypothetical protein T05_1080 [Trichinella murrelli]|uniref:PiggyBac transposable element-derived protein domain-containing protein n=1 Tax=Trichinella murrelli TaxID=144512 RepID=A0A0V0T7F2_9BILA|nr:hypothetical protein T05_1080 [Trichinella murrelli]
MDFDTVFRETRSGQNVRQIIVLPDLDVFEPDTVSENELDCTFQQSHSSSDDEVIEEDDASANARRKSYIWRRRPFNPKTEPFINQMRKYHQSSGQLNTFACTLHHSFFPPSHLRQIIGMLITMAVSEMPRYRMYWANQTRMDTVANCMSRNRFETLLRFLHFNDNDKVVMDQSQPDYISWKGTDGTFKVVPQ